MSASDLKEFPVLDTPAECRCWKCSSRKMSEHRDDGFAPGRGKYRATCQSCGNHTWYDLWKEMCRV